jgi:hypothetical protein
MTQAKASAFAFNTTAIAVGLLPGTQKVFDAQAELAAAVAFDLYWAAA